MRTNTPDDRESTDSEIIDAGDDAELLDDGPVEGEWRDAENVTRVGGPVREPAADGGSTRREFMAAGIGTATLSLLPGREPVDRDAWPSEDEIEAPTAAADGAVYTSAELSVPVHTEVRGPRTGVSFPNIDELDTATMTLSIRFDSEAIHLDANVDDDSANGGVFAELTPEATERLAAALEAQRPNWVASEDTDDDFTDSIPVEKVDGFVDAGLVHAESGFEAETAWLQVRDYAEGLHLSLGVDDGFAQIRSQVPVFEDRLAVAKALRTAVAEWRRWPATDD